MGRPPPLRSLVINGVLAHPLEGDAVATAYASKQRLALAAIPPDRMTRATVPLVAIDMVGVDALRQLVSGVTDHTPARSPGASAAPGGSHQIDDLVDQRALPGHPVHLSTTDLAGHAALTAADLPRLATSAIDPDAGTREYVQDRLESAARNGLDKVHHARISDRLVRPYTDRQDVRIPPLTAA